MTVSVADPDLELKEGPSLDFLVLLAFFSSVIFSLFLPKIRGGASPRSAIGSRSRCRRGLLKINSVSDDIL